MAEPMANQVLHWLHDRNAYEKLRGELKALKEQVAVPGACERAAEAIVELVGEKKKMAA